MIIRKEKVNVDGENVERYGVPGPLAMLLVACTFIGACWLVAWGIKLVFAIGRLVVGL